jgi:uncharacterized membrane protein YhdT
MLFMKNAGVWVGCFILVFALTIFSIALTYEYYGSVGPGPGLFPLWLSGALIVLSLLYIAESMFKNKISFKDILPRGKGLRNTILFILSFILFMIIVPWTGFCIAGIIMLFIVFLPSYKWYVGLGISTLVTIFFFFVFYNLLKIPLPVNSLGW